MTDLGVLTPWEQHGDVWFKRDDLYDFAGAKGGKVRTALRLARAGLEDGSPGLVSCGARESTQLTRIALIAQGLGVPARLHVPAGAETSETAAAARLGAELVRVKAGYLSVLKARAREDAVESGYTLIPWGLECPEAIEETAAQAGAGVPEPVRRLVVPVGSGMTLAGILHGLAASKLARPLPILGVCVGAAPDKRLDEWAPPDWRFRVELVEPDRPYNRSADTCLLNGVRLDPYYEAKAIPHIEPGDGLWVVAIRPSEEHDFQAPDGDEFGQWFAGLPKTP